MSLAKPILEDKSAFDCEVISTQYFYFDYSGGDRYTAVQYQFLADDDSIAYGGMVTTQNKFFTINFPISGTTQIENGNAYKLRIRFVITTETVPTYGEWSDELRILCLTTPSLTNNIPDLVTNSTFNFTVVYNQAEGELLNDIRANIYKINRNDETDRKIVWTGARKYAQVPPPNSFTYTVNGLPDLYGDPKYIYQVIAVATTINGMEKGNRKTFEVNCVKPDMYANFNVETNGCSGLVTIESSAQMAVGVPSERLNLDTCFIPNGLNSDQTINYAIDCVGSNNDYYVNPIESKFVTWNDGFTLKGDYLIKLWVYGGQLNKPFISFFNNRTNVWMHLVIVTTGENSAELRLYRSDKGRFNTINITFDRKIMPYDKLCIYVKKHGTDFTVQAEIIETAVWADLEWNADSSVFKWGATTLIPYEDEEIEWSAGLETFLDYLPRTLTTDLMEFDKIVIGNCLFDHIYISSDTSQSFSTEKPMEWQDDTLFLCNFNQTLSAGNFEADKIAGILIKRRALDTDDWITLYSKKVYSASDIVMSLKDYGVPQGVEQTYALVPIDANGMEGNYIIAKTTPKWFGTFIASRKKAFRLNCSVSYDSVTDNVTVGSFVPIGTKYPIVVNNSENDYKSGSMSVALYGYDFEKNRRISREDVVKQTQDLLDFLKEDTIKFLYDWNGNIVMFRVSSSPTTSFNQSYGNGVTVVSFNWVEQGKYNNLEDLEENGVTTTLL